MFCRMCGAQINENDETCPYCGAPQMVESVYDTGLDNSEDTAGKESDTYNTSYAYTAIKLKADRSFALLILLSLITCGIYTYYYIYQLAHDINIACEGDGEKTAGLAEFILLGIITCGIYCYIWYYKLGDRLYKNAPRYGLDFTENGTTVLVWMIFGYFLCGIGPFVGLAIINKNANSICSAYNAYNSL